MPGSPSLVQTLRALGAMSVAVLLSSAALGCDLEGTQRKPLGPPRAQMFALVDVVQHCDVVGVVEIVMRARPLVCDGVCEPIDPDLEIFGDRLACPAPENKLLLNVDVPDPGVYYVDVVERFATGLPEANCLALGDTLTIDVTEADLDERREFDLRETSSPCP